MEYDISSRIVPHKAIPILEWKLLLYENSTKDKCSSQLFLKCKAHALNMSSLYGLFFHLFVDEMQWQTLILNPKPLEVPSQIVPRILGPYQKL